MESFYTYLTPLMYWILTIIWLYILIFYLNKLKHKWKKDRLLRLLLLILSIDAFRTFIESIYFGAKYTSLVNLLPSYVFDILTEPQFVIFPKLINLITAILILTIIIHKWLPSEISQKNKVENLIEEQHSDLLKINKELLASTKALKDKEYLLRESLKWGVGVTM
jgi:membrane-associated HD superfamily phosphohydrolase